MYVLCSGLFYIRPTPAAMDLLDRLVQRVETENGWDQVGTAAAACSERPKLPQSTLRLRQHTDGHGRRCCIECPAADGSCLLLPPLQALFNEVIYFPSRPGYTDPLVKRRVLVRQLCQRAHDLFESMLLHCSAL